MSARRADARQTNGDGFGLDNFVESWLKVAESHELMSSSTRYPPILFVDANTLASPDFQCFLGLIAISGLTPRALFGQACERGRAGGAICEDHFGLAGL